MKLRRTAVNSWMSAKASGLEMTMINRRVRSKLSVMLAGLMLFSVFSAFIRPQNAMSAVHVTESVQINNMDSASTSSGDTLGAMTTNTDPQFIKEGSASKKWPLYKTNNTGWAIIDVFPKSGPQKNWVGYNQLSFWAYSTKVRPEADKPIRLRFYPVGNPSTSHYYYYQVPLDWTGWKKITIPLDTVMKQKVGTPADWGQIDFVRIDPAPIGGVAPDAGSILYLDDFRLDKLVEVQPVTASQPSGQYTGSVTVQLSSPTAGASVFYKRIGTDAEFKPYTQPITLTDSAQIVAKASLNGYDSEETTFDYTILADQQVGNVTAAPPAGTYTDRVTVALSTLTAGATVYYSVYGSGQGYVPYNGPLELDRSQTVVTKAVYQGRESDERKYAYVIQPYPALASHPSGEYTGTINVSLTSATPGANLMVKVVGEDADFKPYTGPIPIKSSKQIVTKAVLSGTDSVETTYTYTVLSTA